MPDTNAARTNEKEKNITIVVRYPVGGIRTYLKYIYQFDCFNNFAFTLIAPDGGELELFARNIFKHKEFTFLRCNNTTTDVFKTLRLHKKNTKIDLLHSHGFTSGMICELSIMASNIPHILTSHDVLQSSQFPGVSGVFKKYFIGAIFNQIDSIVCVGNDAMNNLLGFYPHLQKKGNVIAIRNGIDSISFSNTSKRNLRLELNLPDKTFLLGFFGRFMSQKGFRFLIGAIKQLHAEHQELDIQVVSFGWGGFIREEQKIISEGNLAHLFHFLPHTDDMPAAIRGVDLAVLPSLWEACPLLPMEIMVTGTPLITSDCIGMKEVIKDTPVLSFKAGCINSLSAAILNVIMGGQSYKSDIENFSAEASKRFDSLSTAKQLLKHYSGILR